jgi:hypothetical protein
MLVTIAICPIDLEAKPKKILSGEEMQLYDTWIKERDGTQYGFGISKPSDLRWIFAILIAQVLAWVGIFCFKMMDWWKGGKDKDIDEKKKDRQMLLQTVSDIQYVKEHMMTETDVANKVREEIKYLREHGSFIESPGRRSGSRDG